MNNPSHPVQGALCGVLDERLKRPTIGIRDICSCCLSQNSAECNFFSSPCVCFFPKIKEKCNYICNIFCSSFAINPRQPFMQHAVAGHLRLLLLTWSAYSSRLEDFHSCTRGYGGTSVLHAVALQLWLFWGFSLVAPKFLALLAFFILTEPTVSPLLI